jgi:hypothetical protein
MLTENSNGRTPSNYQAPYKQISMHRFQPHFFFSTGLERNTFSPFHKQEK